MILDRLENAERYTSLHPGFAKAFEFLRATQGSQLAQGKHDIDGDKIYAIVASSVGHGKGEARLEAHRKYIDIQFTTRNSDVYGWSALQNCSIMDSQFSEADDIGFYKDAPESWVEALSGAFVIFFPEDAHAPLSAEGEIEKIIIKVAVDY